MLDFASMDKSKTYKAVYNGGGVFDIVKDSAATLEYNESFAKYKHSSGWLAYGADGFGFYVRNVEAQCFTLIPDTPTDITEDQLKDRTKVYTVIRTAGSTKRVKRGDTCVARWAGHGWYIYTDVQRLIKGEHWSYHSATCRVPVPLTKCYDVVNTQGINEVNGNNENNDKTGDETMSNSDKSVKWVKGLDSLDYPCDGIHLACTDSGTYFWVYFYLGEVRCVFLGNKIKEALKDIDAVYRLRSERMVRLCTPDDKLHRVAMASLDSDSTLIHVARSKVESIRLEALRGHHRKYRLEQPEYISERQQKIQELKDKLAELEALEDDQ